MKVCPLDCARERARGVGLHHHQRRGEVVPNLPKKPIMGFLFAEHTSASPKRVLSIRRKRSPR
jgi:hypothetical protein